MKSTRVSLFICIGLPGLILFLLSLIGIFVFLDDSDPLGQRPNPVMLIAAGLSGLALVLVSVGKWKRWAYSIVFLSVPAAFFVYLLLFDGAIIPCALLTLVTALGLSKAAKAHYRKRDAP